MNYLKERCNSIDGRCYKIVNSYEDNIKASDMLAELNLFCLKLMKHLRNKYIFHNSGNPEGRSIIEFLLSNYNPDGIIENDPVGIVNTSFVEDKGKIFGICLREKISGKNKFHDMQILKFVVLHEMAHMANVNTGHDLDFWEIFKFLLMEAKSINLYNPDDYTKTPINYCGLIVDQNPYFNNQLRNIFIG